MPTKKKILYIDDSEHSIGDQDCESCWSEYPKECDAKECSGLIHAIFGDENWDMDYWLYTKCDICGESE